MDILKRFRPSDWSQRDNLILVIWSLAIAIATPMLLWSRAGGLLETVCLGAELALFIWSMLRRGVAWRENLYWLAPLGTLILSTGIYANPFIRYVNILVIPVVLATFYGVADAPRGQTVFWGAKMVLEAIGRFFSIFAKLGEAVACHVRAAHVFDGKQTLAKRIFAGVALLIVVSLFVVLPLLASADQQFARMMGGLVDWVRDIFNDDVVLRLMKTVITSLLTVAGVLAWGRAPNERDAEEKPVDSVVVGIVLGGLLVIYLLFIGVQAKSVLIGQLPFEFAETVYMVKSGFWQLIALAAINIVVYLACYRRTVAAVQSVLGAFTLASLLLVVSAGHRMALYVTGYGFSYEKFYATLAVIYCIVVFVWLVTRLFSARRADVIRFGAVLFIWMYAGVSLLPVEQFILRANVALAKRPDSRIQLAELTMLSTDVLSVARERFSDGTLAANGRLTETGETVDIESRRSHWDSWLKQKQAELDGKTWFQMTVSELIQ